MPDSPGATALDSARARLDMMSQVHRRLHDPRSVDAPLDAYLKDLCTDLIHASDTPLVRLAVRSDPIHLNLGELMSVSLIVAELVTNSLKHAFVGRTAGNITIDINSEPAGRTITVADDGPGLPRDFQQAAAGRLGQGILRSLARQIDGKITFESGAGKGTVARLVFR